MYVMLALSTLLGAFAHPSPGVAQQIFSDRSKICQALLGASTAEALEAAVATGEYGYDVLTKTIAGTERTVFLFGESHHKSSVAGAAGKGVLARFRDVALEGVSIDRLWGGRLISWLIRSGEESLKAQDRHLSTIDDARADPSKRTFHVEEGHRFSWKENLGSVLLITQIFAPAAACVASIGYFGYAAMLAPDQLPRSTLLLSLSFAGAWLNYAYKPDWIVAFLLGKPRDLTMAKNITKILTDHADVDRLLVVVGYGHVAGVSARLRRKGYRSEVSVRRSSVRSRF